MASYIDGLQAEYGWCVQNGRTERAKAVSAELASLGVVPTDTPVDPAGTVETAMSSAPETATKPRRARK